MEAGVARASAPKVKGYRSDASKFDEAEKLISDILADFGTLQIVVNNAGITKDGLLMRMTEEQLERSDGRKPESLIFNVPLKRCFKNYDEKP